MIDILKQYQNSFSEKVVKSGDKDSDVLMEVFGITPKMKNENMQYWGRELGMCWQKIIYSLLEDQKGFSEPFKRGFKEPCDLILSDYAVDTKYRLGSGDSGTLRKFKRYSEELQSMNLKPLLLILREDNLQGSVNSCLKSGWEIMIGEEAFDFIKEKSGTDLKKGLTKLNNKFKF